MIELNIYLRELKMRQNTPFWFSPFLSFFVLVLTFVMDQNAEIIRPIWKVLSKSRNAKKFESERLKNLLRYKKHLKSCEIYRGFCGRGQGCAPNDTRFRHFAELYLP